MPFRALAVALALLFSVAATPAAAADSLPPSLGLPPASAVAPLPAPGSDQAMRVGRALLITGSVVQVAGLGLGIANTITAGGLISAKVAYSLGSIPFAPLSVLGFQLLLDDGTPGARERAIGRGLLVGSLYSSLEAVLAGTTIASHGAWCEAADRTRGPEDVPACFEDLTPLFEGVRLVPHAIVGVAMLIPGIILMVQGSRLAARAAGPVRLAVAPAFHPGGGGLQLVGRFP